MPTGQVNSYFSDYSTGLDGPYRVVRLVLDGNDVISYIEFEDGKAGLEAETVKDAEFWYHDKGVPPGLIMEFFLMCFEAPIPEIRGWKDGKTYEW